MEKTDDTMAMKDTTSKDEEHDMKAANSPLVFSWRLVVYIILQFSIVTLGIPRTTFNMAFVCSSTRRLEALSRMNRSGAFGPPGNDFGTGGQFWTNFSLGQDFTYPGKVMSDLNWDPEIKGLVLSSPVMLAFASPLLSDVLRLRLGNSCVFSAIFLLAGTFTLMTPFLARTNTSLVIATQVALGLTMPRLSHKGNGSARPHLEINRDCHYMRTRFSSDCFNISASRTKPAMRSYSIERVRGSQRIGAKTSNFSEPQVLNGEVCYSTGAIFTGLVNGFLCLIPINNGWPFIFYVSSLAYFLYAAAWNVLGSEWPETHRFVSASEKSHILSTRVQLASGTTRKRLERPPYLTMFSAPAVLAFFFLACCQLWCAYIVLVTLPVYLNSVLGFSAQQTGVVFSCVTCMRFAGSLLWTVLGNALIKHRVMSYSVAKKTCLCLAFGGAACVHLAVAFFDQSSRWTAVGCIMIGQGLQTALGLLNSMPQDLAPRFAGTLHGTATSVALLVALTAPLIVSALTPNGMYKEWRVVWLLLSAVYLSGSIVFLIFGEIKLQAWADIPSDGGTVKETIDTSQDKNINQHLLND
ncbi:hypothetical protein RRG08_052772 [Elysia crispata]|uniref:Major facilitator superfamily (MFS) profile domain-containing protein n=1 Tax=Elysia crispata TaxID=231223 RepID=A0AAE1B6I7_9GAST|nr:hypothetical protein RRG08_052772 [Elysia crispata]